MDFYEPAELERVLTRSAGILGIELVSRRQREIARRSRGTPRIANRLLRRVRDYAEVRADGIITRDIAKYALAVYDVDELGLDRLDRAVLSALTRSFGGGPVGVSTLAVAVGEEADHRRGGVRAVPGACRHDRSHPPRARRHRSGVDAPGHDTAARGRRSGPGRLCSNDRERRRVRAMVTAGLIVAALAALLHVYIFVMESLTWTSPRTRAVFGTTEEEAQTTKLLAFNQGFYNLFLAIVTVIGVAAVFSGATAVGVALVFAGVGSMLAAAVVLLAAAPGKARAAVTQGLFPLVAVALLVVGLAL